MQKLILMLAVAGSIPLSYGSPCDQFINNAGFSGHGRLKADTIGMNIELKRLKQVPLLEKEPVFKKNELDLLALVGEISLTSQSETLVLVDLKVEGVVDISQKSFAFQGDYSVSDGVFYVLQSEQLKIHYYPDSMRLELQGKNWPEVLKLRLNHPPRRF